MNGNATVALPNGHELHYTLYGPSTAPTTFVLIHGSPGSGRDFKYLAPLLVVDGANAIALDLPGFGRTSAKAAGGLWMLDGNQIARAVMDALTLLPHRHCVLVGHSMGGHTTLQIAANPRMASIVHGLALLNCAGLRAHKARWPRLEMLLSSTMRLAGRGSNPVTRLNHSIYVNQLGFSKKTPEFDCASALYRAASADYAKLTRNAEAIVARRVPAYVAVALDDRVIEAEVGLELADALKAQVVKEHKPTISQLHFLPGPKQSFHTRPIHATLPFPKDQLLHYTRWGAPTAATTIVCLHGAPGTFADFQYLAPLLVANDVNVLAFDLPGNGRTSVGIVGGLFYVDAKSIADIIVEALLQLPHKRYILLGHSMGGHATLQVASASSLAPRLAGIALLNPTGLRAPRRARPRLEYWFGVAMRYAGDNTDYFTKWNRSIYVDKFKFSDDIPTDDFTVAFYRMVTADYENLRIQAEALARRGVPAFVAVANDDRVIESAIGTDLATVLRASTLKTYQKGGHNIPKTQAEDLGSVINAWRLTITTP
ncbi:serine protease family S33 [Achlya hypogyna]|uniref:Serine protease family S33 n=1 Tax=Achlya hypogyna TaxID=1202772 RepID=A0A1V9ZB76_ACHHY|nr:serine protease family S33 [Achlya hypogyna]